MRTTICIIGKGIGLLICIFYALAVKAQDNKLKVYAGAFYNLENLFDTEDDPLIADEEFTPKGANNWTPEKYQKKLKNMGFVIQQLAQEYCPQGPAFIGLAEIENRRVLSDLVQTASLSSYNYQIVHYDSPDRRGIDVGFLYNPQQFELISSQVFPYHLPTDSSYKTRDQLLVTGRLGGEQIHVLVNHWPSRYGNKSSALREFAAGITKHIVDSLQQVDPEAKIIIMGDLNDDPTDRSTRIVLDAKKKQSEVVAGGLYNTMWKFYSQGIGTLVYQNKWNLFDQIIVNYNLLGQERNTLKFWKAEIFNRNFLLETEGKYKGYPKRTFSGNIFVNGYSDHFPVLVYLVKQMHELK